MKKKYRILFIIYYILVGVILTSYRNITNIATKVSNDLNYIKCGGAEQIPRPIPQITTIIYALLLVGTPLILIIFSIITLVKAISSGNAEEIDKSKKKVFKKFIIAALIFFIGFIVQFVVNQATSNDEDKKTAASCIKCFLYYSSSYCQYSEPFFEDDGTRTPSSNKPIYVNPNAPVKTSNSSGNNPSPGGTPSQVNGDYFKEYAANKDYLILNIREGWDNFYKRMRDNNVYEASNPAKYADKCLSFAYYHAHSYYSGDYSGYATAANSYARASHFAEYDNESKQTILKRVYEELAKGKPVILHVSGTSLHSRHYVTVVGVRKSVYSFDLQESDFLIFDSYQGDVTVLGTRRVMITGADCNKKEYSGHQIYYLKD